MGTEGLGEPSRGGTRAIELPWLLLSKKIHLLIEAIAYGQGDSIIHASVDKHGYDPFFLQAQSWVEQHVLD